MIDKSIPFLALVSDEETASFARQIGVSMGYESPNVEMYESGADMAKTMQEVDYSPKYFLIDVGAKVNESLQDIDSLAEACSEDVVVVVIGETNDINFYRALIQRGVSEYFPKPVEASELRAALTTVHSAEAVASTSKVITFLSAASGDGASTIALNTAYALSMYHEEPTVIVDMDFQFGMVARNLDVNTSYGIKDLFEHSDRKIDATLLNRMVASYSENLDVISAPSDLRMWPQISPEVVNDLLSALKDKYKYIILDMPHVWSSWLAAGVSHADYNVLVAQLWLRSVTHTSRLLNAWRELGVPEEGIVSVINRSGAKFKEGVTARDYESVCHRSINFYMANDIRTIVAAENEGKTIPEIGTGPLVKQFKEIADFFAGKESATSDDFVNQAETKSSVSLGGLFKK